MIITNIKTMKLKCSKSGWDLFVKHQNILENENPNTLDEKTEICLNKIEVLQYEYNHFK